MFGGLLGVLCLNGDGALISVGEVVHIHDDDGISDHL